MAPKHKAPSLMTNLFMSSKGTAAIEATMAISTLILIIFFILGIFYFLFAKVVVENSGYNSVICVAEKQPVSICKQKMISEIYERLPWGRLDHVQLKQNKKKQSVFIQWSFLKKYQVQYSKALRY